MIVVVDTGTGNLRSLLNALRALSRECIVASEPPADRPGTLILPGVGAFGHAASALEACGWKGVIPGWISAGTRMVGICLGMQLLFDESEESPGARGLGLMNGKNVKLDPANAKVPHIGWARLRFTRRDHGGGGLEWAYFVHSYAAAPDPAEEVVAAWSGHGAAEFPAVVRRGGVIGVQFHPEKSQGPGLAWLDSLLGGGP
jgi:glutamine amidotransferase